MATLNEKGQMLILFTLFIATIVISISILHAQNILAGMESSRAMILFPKDEIYNLRDLAGIACDSNIMSSYNDKLRYSQNVSNQVKLLYSQKGVYGDIIIIEGDKRVILNFVSGDVEYSEKLNFNEICGVRAK
ncbi:MAG: hypothetical protein NDP13_06835 [Crenarchaeota archaeon]|nr:hypothetical protein [Thermoproteota archaeon]